VGIFEAVIQAKACRRTTPASRRVRCQRGTVAVEFALVSPFLIGLIFGIIWFGVVMNHYLTITNAAIQGAQRISVDRGVDTTPYADAVTAINAASYGLNTSNLVITTSIGTTAPGTTCTDSTSTTCASLLLAGSIVTVTVAYPIQLTFLGSFNYLTMKVGNGTANLSVTTADVVQ